MDLTVASVTTFFGFSEIDIYLQRYLFKRMLTEKDI